MDQLSPILERFKKIGDLSSLRRDGRDFSFADVHSQILEVYNYLVEIIQNPDFWELLPENIRKSAISPFNEIANLAERIKNFSPQQGENQSTRDSIANSIKSHYSQLYAPVFLPLEVFTVKKSLLTGNIQQLSKTAQDTIAEINKQKARGEELLKTIQEAAAVGGASKFAGIFGDEAVRHKKAANTWLAISTISAAAIIWFLFDTFTNLTDALKNFTVSGDSISITLQLFFAKILILSFLSVVFYQIVKNYNANMHLSITNKHRENSLKTFQSFVESSNDQKTRDIVLVQATQTIFTTGDTGYITSKDGGHASFDAVKLIEQSQKS